MSCGEWAADEAEVTEAVDVESFGVFWRVVRDEAGKCSFGSMPGVSWSWKRRGGAGEEKSAWLPNVARSC